MLHLEKTEYDLNTLFSFEVLKEILLKLAKSQIKLEEDINNIKNANIKHDKIFLKIEQSIGEDLGISDVEENENNNESELNENNENDDNDLNDNKNNSEEEKEKEKELIKEEEKEKELIKEEEKEKELKKEEEKEVIKEKEKELIKEEENITKIEGPKNYENFAKNNENEPKETNNEESPNMQKNKTKKRIKKRSSNEKTESSDGGAYISPELFSKMMKQLKEHQLRISTLEKKLKTESKNIKNIENQFKNLSLNSEAEFKLINDKINSLFEKNKDYDQKLEDLQVKVADFNIFSMFKDNGDGTIDATKIMVKALEEKVFKKFDLIDKRYKIDSLENLKTKTNVDNLIPKLDQIHREIDRINEIGNQHQEDLENYKKENEEFNNDTKNNFNLNLKQKIDDMKAELEKMMNNKISLLENKLKDLKDNYGDNFDILKLGLGNNDVNKETVEALEKKINDLRKKSNDIENTLKLFMINNETDPIKKELKDLKLILDKKITKEDLKELYNYHLNTVDEINDIKDQEASSFDELRKTIKDLQNLQQRIESINGNLSLLQKTPKIGGGPIIDFSRYVDQQKLTDTLRPILKEFDKIYREIESVKRDMSVDEEENSKNLKNSITKLDEDINNKINEYKTFVQKKYLEKMEFHKTIKSLEVQIKSINEESKKDADTWLLAKRPLKCFNCASCEANIKNDYSAADYLPWKKYPRGEKIHRMGQGFSHMLQMMTSEFVKSIEKNEFPQEIDISAKNSISNNISAKNSINNNISAHINDKPNIGLIINGKDDTIKNLKKFSKIKLPKVKQYSNSKMKLKKYDDSLPVSDDENNYIENDNYENEIKNKKNSPKILKITKLEKNLGKRSVKDLYGNILTTSDNNSNLTQKETNISKIGRNNVFLKTEKNTYDTSENKK